MNCTEAVALAKAGEERGFGYLYETTYKSKYYLALQYMKDEEAAKDVVQEAYIKAFSKLHTLSNPEAFSGWLGMIVANTAKDMLAKKQPTLFSDMGVDNEGEQFEYEIEDDDIEAQPELSYTRQETKEMVHEMIDSLSEEQRLCILMFHIEGASIAEIAKTLGCSENTVKSRLNYGRKNLRIKAEELQKKGYKLYSIAPLPLFVMLLKSEQTALAADGSLVAAGRFMAETVFASRTMGVTESAGITGGTSATGGAGVTRGTSATGSAGVTAKAGTAVKAGLLHTAAGKAAAVIVGVCVTGGATFAGLSYVTEKTESQTEIVQEETAEETPEIKDPIAVAPEDYPELIAGNLTKEELEYVLAYGWLEEGLEDGFTQEDYDMTANCLCEPSDRVDGPIEEYGTTSDSKTKYSLEDLNRMFESFSDYQYTEEENQSKMIRVEEDTLAFAAATVSQVITADITEAKYTDEEMEISYIYDWKSTPDEHYIAEKKAILKPNEDGLYRIVEIEEVKRETISPKEPENEQEVQQEEREFPVGDYYYVAPAGGTRAGLHIDESGKATVNMCNSADIMDVETMEYQITLDEDASTSETTAYVLKSLDGKNDDWEFTYFKNGDYFMETTFVDADMTDWKWVRG